MVMLNTPKGDDRVASGVKAKKIEEGFTMRQAGTHTEADYAELGKSPSRKMAVKPHIDK